MPLLRLQTNAPLDGAVRDSLMAALSARAAQLLSKPESYLMVLVEEGVGMMLGGSNDPAAFFEVRSIGAISPDQAKALSKSLSEIIEEKIGIPAGRVYSNYAGWERNMWGHSGSTF